jgi:hypothetical protein
MGKFQDYVRHLRSFNQNIYHLLLHLKAYIYRTFISQYFWMIKMVARAPAPTRHHIDNGTSDEEIVQFSTLFPQSIHTTMSSIHGLIVMWKEWWKLTHLLKR